MSESYLYGLVCSEYLTEMHKQVADVKFFFPIPFICLLITFRVGPNQSRFISPYVDTPIFEDTLISEGISENGEGLIYY